MSLCEHRAGFFVEFEDDFAVSDLGPFEDEADEIVLLAGLQVVIDPPEVGQPSACLVRRDRHRAKVADAAFRLADVRFKIGAAGIEGGQLRFDERPARIRGAGIAENTRRLALHTAQRTLL
ncbi:MAG: hypothetical protein AB7T37_01175 [Dehalococcoidia bacterium]